MGDMNMLGDGRGSLGSGEEWARVRGRLRAEVGDAAFRSWLKPLTMVGAKDGVARISVPTRFMRDWVVSHYAERIQSLWQDEGVGIERVEIVVQPPPRPSLRVANPRVPTGT